MPLPEAFRRLLGFWFLDRPKEDFVFANQPGGKPPVAHVVRAYLRRLLDRTGIDKKVTPHQLQAHLCYTVARVRRRARGYPGAIRAREPGDDADLLACERGSDGRGVVAKL